MSEYRIFETEQFQKDLRQIVKSGLTRIAEKLVRTVYPELRRNPNFGPYIRKLKNFTPETWRYRIGRWRFFFELDDQEKLVFLIAATHRGSAY